LESLKRKKDFKNLLDHGNRLRPAPWLIISFSKNDLGIQRIGFTASAKIGNAIIRNRLKRWSREFLRRQDELSMDVNLVFLKPRDANLYKELKHDDFDKLLEKSWKNIKRRFE
jgi:ribonuclease P protein component